MQLNDDKNVLNKVSGSLNIEKITEDSAETENELNTIEEYVSYYINENFVEYDVELLMNIYSDGISLLNLYEIKVDSNLITKLQYITGVVNYNINTKMYNSIMESSKILAKNAKEIGKSKVQVKSIYSSQKTMVNNIISIILAISIIPTAIAGIEKIDGNYILPFVATIVLFGMVMIMFVYIINHINPNKFSWIILIIMFVITIMFWLLPWKINISLDVKPTSIEIADSH